MTSLKDIAEAAGVSIRTVSRVLGASGYVGAQTREQVLAAAARLGYRPNLAARALRTGRSVEVGLVVGELNELHMAKMMAFEARLHASGYGTFVLFAHASAGDGGGTDAVRDQLLERSPAGVALLPQARVDVERLTRSLVEAQIPCVLMDPRGATGDAVRIGREDGVCSAVHYLAKRGCVRIAYLGMPDRTRQDGYERAIGELGREPIQILGDGVDDALVDQLVAAGADGVQVFSDVWAMRLLGKLHARGIQVPDEIAVVGFDDRELARDAWPSLTTLAQPNADVGRVAAELLLEKINGNTPPSEGWSRTLPMSLVIRESA